MNIYVLPERNFISITCTTLCYHRSDSWPQITQPGLAFSLCSDSKHCSLGCRTPPWFPRAKQLYVCIAVTVCLAPATYMACVCICLLLFTFSFVDNTENHSETPAAPAPPPSTLPKPKPKPKPPKTPVPPKGAAAGASPKGDEVPPIKKNTKASGKQAPIPPPKPTSRNTTRESGKYAPSGVESKVLGSGVGLIWMMAFWMSGVLGWNTSAFSFDTENAQEIPLLLSPSKESWPVD